MSCECRRPFDTPCSCEEACFLLDAIERAWAEIVCDRAKADQILRDALDAHHNRTIEYFNEKYGK